jgi:hypothetical protein
VKFSRNEVKGLESVRAIFRRPSGSLCHSFSYGPSGLAHFHFSTNGLRSGLHSLAASRLEASAMSAMAHWAWTARIEGAPVFPSMTLTFKSASMSKFEKSLPTLSLSICM